MQLLVILFILCDFENFDNHNVIFAGGSGVFIEAS